MFNENAKWIWINDAPKQNEYAVFEEKFDFYGNTAILTLCTETDYVLAINGNTVAFGQFAGYRDCKYYEEIDLTAHLVKGQNTLTLTVRYEGTNSLTHIDDGAGAIYSLDVDGKCALYSSKNTKCGYDNRYIQHQERQITMQLGLTSGMSCDGYTLDMTAIETGRVCALLPRPVKKSELLPFEEAVALTDSVYDLGREIAGYLRVTIKASSACLVKITYGERLYKGNVLQIIRNRDFSLDFNVSEGINEFTSYFVRIAGRYLQPILPDGAEIVSIGILPFMYAVTEKPFKLSQLDQRIYDTCVRTLRLCMHDHYEDCPWREQALYVLDSRNQMLCGYFAFEETDYPRAMLEFMAKGTRDDGFLELTYPAVKTPAIPFFSIMFPVTVYEYIKYTGDSSVLSAVFPTVKRIMENCKERIGENGLIRSFESPYWNFYEWTEGSADIIPWGKDIDNESDYYHLILNCAFVYAGEKYKELCALMGEDADIAFGSVKKGITDTFFNKQTGIFSLRTDRPELCSQLGNAFALLIGLGDERTVDAVKNDTSLIPATLSMLSYVYDALLIADSANKDHILKDIRAKYNFMLDRGATSFWETLKELTSPDEGSSLCHGWSALPVYYYHLFFGEQ